MKKKYLFIFIVVAIILGVCGCIVMNLIENSGEFYSDRKVEQLVKKRYGSSCKLLDKRMDFFEVSYPLYTGKQGIKTIKQRFDTIVYTYTDGDITFDVTSYSAKPGFEGNVDYGKSIETNYYEKYILKLKEDKFLKNLDYGFDDNSDFCIRINDASEIEMASSLIEKIRSKVSKEDNTYFRFYINGALAFNSSMTEYEQGNEYYVDKEYLEREYTSIMKPFIDDASQLEKYKPRHAIVGNTIYGEYDFYSDDYLVNWNRRIYDAGYPKNDVWACRFVELAGGEVKYIGEDAIRWEVDGDKFEMNISVSKEDIPKKKNQDYYDYKKVSSNKYKCQNKTYEFNFTKNNEELDIVIKDIFTYQGEFYGNVKILISDVEKLINRKMIMNYTTGEISFEK